MFDKNICIEMTPSVNFTNVLRTTFTLVDPESVKMIDNLTVFFTLLGSASIKALRKTLMKLSPSIRTLSPLLNEIFMEFGLY